MSSEAVAPGREIAENADFPALSGLTYIHGADTYAALYGRR
jgi:hypothetical protein